MRTSTKLLALVLATFVSACDLPPRHAQGSPSAHVSNGELYKPGLVAYDEFFSAVYSLQVEMANVPDDRRAARSNLVSALGLLPTATSDKVLDVLRDRAGELKKDGVRFVVTQNNANVEGRGPPEARAIAQGLGAAISNERSIGDRVSKIPGRADALLHDAPTLESSVDTDFQPAQRGTVKNELAAAKRVLAQLSSDAKVASKASDQYADDLSKAATGMAPPPPGAPPPAPPEKKPSKKPYGSPPPARTSTPPPATTSEPPKPPPTQGGDDFNP